MTPMGKVLALAVASLALCSPMYFSSFNHYTSLGVVAFAVVIGIYFLFAADDTPLPGPVRTRFWGSLFEYAANFDRIPDFIIEQTKKAGGRTWIITAPKVGPFSQGLFVSTPENLQHVLKDEFDKYVKGNVVHEVLGDFLGEGIFVTDGPTWKHHRKVASHMFSKKLLTLGSEVAFAEAEKLVERLSNTQGTVDLQDLFFRCTIDIFGEIAFNVKLNCIESTEQHEFAGAFDRCQQICHARMANPFFSLVFACLEH